ncbi:helix-turn-helix domain-containing protein [Leptospira santarosai]|uniref:helix-turn-helix domain-containing protein n=1 Tax=Leptospira santarosai TaxID=28183 RepID=UPI000A632247|nr:helix-turn-helix domain-containing protein [Leptospira santarosai]
MRWRDRYEKEGLEGVKWNGISGRPPKLTLELKKELKRMILNGPTSYGYAKNIT